MEIEMLGASDARLLRPRIHADDRGRFMRTWCARSFADAGIDFAPAQGNSSVTRARGTVRGMHFQRAPEADAKIVRCSAGSVHDVIVDLRPDSATRGQSFATELSSEAGQLLFVPAGFAHGFQTLCDDVVVEYLMGVDFNAALADGYRHDDRALPVEWPEPITVISAADRSWPDLAGRLPWLSEAQPELAEEASHGRA